MILFLHTKPRNPPYKLSYIHLLNLSDRFMQMFSKSVLKLQITVGL